jgi:hypothetical protein
VDGDLAWLKEKLKGEATPLTKKRIDKLARQLSRTTVLGSLGIAEGERLAAYLLRHEGGLEVQFWAADGTTPIKWNDSHIVLKTAQIAYLQSECYPVFESCEDADDYARALGASLGRLFDPYNPTAIYLSNFHRLHEQLDSQLSEEELAEFRRRNSNEGKWP